MRHKFVRNKHHLRPKRRGGDKRGSNIVLIDVEKHNLIHKIFHNLTWYEIILVMIRLAQAKHYENIEPRIEKLYIHLQK